ncbi:MAG: type II toxin-antitoxin system VapC family toxin [Candidatus Krumholzibacteria bacterium]|nr:type II toxin-antitoxin system VapC family toxin [Candidatus Krumholzibacteria bacterium]
MNVVDSSGWLEYFADGPNADFFGSAIEDTDHLVVPSLTIFEVFKKLLAQRSETEALLAAAAMQQGRVVDLDAGLSLEAARLSLEYKLPLADSVILATAQAAKAEFWTQDADFKGLAGVKYIAR